MTRLIAVAVLATARLAHEINRAYCLTLGDDSQKPWDDAPPWQQNSAIMGVEFHLANPEADASASHNSWMDQKLADGWVYGEVKDELAKTHPCIVPFTDLPAAQQLKDVLFKATVHAGYPLFAASSDATTPEPDPEASAPSSDLVAELTTERDALQAELAAANDTIVAKDAAIAAAADKLTKLRGEMKAVKGARKPGKLRTFKSEAHDLNDDQRTSLAELLAAADHVEVIFTQEGKEVGALAPVRITGNPWQLGRFLSLSVPVDIAGPIDAETRFDGYAVIADGETLCHRSRGEPVVIPAGQALRLVNEIAL